MEKNSHKERVSLSSRDRLFNFYNLGNDYIVIKIEYNNYRNNKGILGGFSTVLDITPEKTVILEKG